MRLLNKFLKNHLGMTTIEMVMGAGLVGVAALGVSSLMKSMGGSTRDAEIVIERTQLGSSLGVFLNSGTGCSSLQNGDFITSPDPQEYTLPGYDAKDGAGNAITKYFMFDGFTFNPVQENDKFALGKSLRYNRIKSFTIQRQVIDSVKEIELKDFKLKKAVIKVKLAVNKLSRNPDPAKAKAEELQFPETRFEYNIPVLFVSESSNGSVPQNVIYACGDTSSMAEACFALKGEFDAATEDCKLPETCESLGSYSTVTCAPRTRSTDCNDYSRGTPTPNPVTGGFSCPAGSMTVSTGGDTWYKNVDCGKKCTQRVNFSIGFYSCLKCPEPEP